MHGATRLIDAGQPFGRVFGCAFNRLQKFFLIAHASRSHAQGVLYTTGPPIESRVFLTEFFLTLLLFCHCRSSTAVRSARHERSREAVATVLEFPDKAPVGPSHSAVFSEGCDDFVAVDRAFHLDGSPASGR